MEYEEPIKKRLKRIEGQVRGVLKMMEGGEHCKSVVSQLSAIRSATDRLLACIVAANLEHCILEDLKNNNSRKSVQEAVELLVKSR